MMDYLTRHPEKLWEALAQHVQLVLLTLVLSVALAAALTVWSLNRPRLSAALHGFLSVVYLWNNCEEFRQFWIDLWEGIKDIAVKVWEGIKM